MKNNIKLTIVVPNYNNAKFIKRCIESIIISNSEEVEIIVIDDGSTDDSLKVLDSIRDYRLRVYKQKNQGVSAARNKGIEAAQGDYILFCDADDYYNDGAIDILLEELQLGKKKFDLHIFGALCKTESSSDNWNDFDQDGIRGENCLEILIYHLFTQGKYSSPWNKVYKVSIIQENQLQFVLGLKTGEDNLFNIMYALKCENINVLDSKYPLYTYCYGESEYSSSKLNNTLMLLKQLKYKIKVKEELLYEYFTKFNTSSIKQKKIKQKSLDSNIILLYQYGKRVNQNDKLDYYKSIKKDTLCYCIIKRNIYLPSSLKDFIRAVLVWYNANKISWGNHE